MNTLTHLAVGAALVGRRSNRWLGLALLGGLLPDLSIFIFYAWAKWQGFPEAQIWQSLYWQEPWQVLSALSNSSVLWALVLIVGIRVPWLWPISIAALAHLVLDFPFHADDAHKHFWPLTDWRFHSPLSYWDRAHHAGAVRWLEMTVISTALGFFVWKDARSWVRRSAAGLLLAYFGVDIYFAWAFS